MAGDDGKRKKTTHRRHGGTRSSKSRTNPDNADATPIPSSASANDRAPDLNALRKARLARINQCPEDTPEEMKYEYEKRIKTVTHVSGERAQSRRKTSRDDPSDRKEPKATQKSTHHPEQRNPKDWKRLEREIQTEDESDDEYEYVYLASASHHPRRDTKTRDSVRQREHRPSVSLRSSRKKDDVRRIPERRHTEPAEARLSRPVNDEDVPTRAAKTKEATQPDSTSTIKPERPAVRRSATTTMRSRTEHGASKTSPSGEPAARRSVGLFGGLMLPKQPPTPKKVSCLTCGADDVPIQQSAKLPCTHRMCHSCLKRIFTMSVSDPAHMPPRCCTEQHIDLKHVDKLFSNEFKVLWNRKFDEYHTKNRIYCPARKCGAWIKPKYITMEKGRKVGRCKHCKTVVCATCSQKMHTTRDCPKDPETKAFAEVAKKEGWKRCYSCSAMVELKEGCNHMTCRCTAEFCMVCGLKWKTCDCPWFNYDAVDAHLGDPARQQEQMDRRRVQVDRDEELARRMQRMAMFDAGNGQNIFAFADNPVNANFVQQAREALTANYVQAGQAARTLMNGFGMGRGTPPPGLQQDMADVFNAMGLPGMRPNNENEDAVPGRRNTARRRMARQAEEQRRLQDWANSVAT